MPTAAGPNTKGEENLVFGYDLGDTRNSYKGEPTVNLVTDPNTRNFDGGTKGNWTYQTVAGSGSISTDNPKSGTYSAKLTRSGAGGEVNYYWNAGPGLSLTPGSTYTFSMDVWCDKPGMAKLFSYLAGTNGSSAYHPGDSKWHRLSMQFAPAASTAAAQIRFGILTSNSNYPVTAYFDNAQIEQNTHVTPFTAGTRSATQGLIDLTGNSTIDLSNVSFDSNAQMTFDGTNDTASTTTNITLGGNFSMEAVVYRDTSATGDIISSWNNPYRFLWRITSGNVQGFAWNNGGASNTATGTGTVSTGVYRHVTVTYDGVSVKFYTNGLLTDTSAKSFSLSNITAMQVGSNTYDSVYFDGKIPFLKIYNRALTASEVQSNYNATKSRFNL